jgi:hypothetical protein
MEYVKTTAQQEQNIIELRSVVDHCACTTTWSFDRPVRTGDIIKVKRLLSSVRSAASRAKTVKCERNLRMMIFFQADISFI